MSANVDKSLDTIIGERKTNRKHLASRRHRKAGTKATIAPVGGVKKPTKQKPVAKAVPTGPSGAPRSNKIVVSGLVSEAFRWPLLMLQHRLLPAHRRGSSPNQGMLN